MAEATIRIETAPEGSESSEAEDIQESEHEVQEVETLAWQSALSDVTAQLSRLAEAQSLSSTQSNELRALVETQRQMIQDLLAANQTANAELLTTVRNLLTPQEPPPAVIPIPMNPVEPVVEAVPEAAETNRRRYRAL